MGLANLLEDIKTNTDDKNLQTVQQQDQFEEQDAQSLGTAGIVCSLSQDVQSAYKSIISVSVKADDSKWLANNTVMATWAASRSLLLSNTYESITRTTTEVIAPLLKTVS